MNMTAIGYVLHPFQKTGVAETRKRLLDGPTLLVAPTGSGKTVMAAAIAEKYRSVLVVAHRRELIAQSHATMPSHVMSMSVDEALKFGPDNVQLLVIDEAHRSAAASYRRLIKKYPNTARLGLTATPLRTDGQGLGDAFDHLVSVSSVKKLMASGFLVPYRLFQAPDEALERLPQLKISGGDYDQKELAGLVNTPKLVGKVVDEYKEHASGRTAIAFGVNVNHSRAMESSFLAGGVRAVHIDGNASMQIRAAALLRLSRREIDVLCSVNLFTEGWDCPSVSCVIMARPTASLTLYLQSVGRGLRTDSGKTDLLLLDHAGNVARHGYPDEDREWSLLGRLELERREAEINELKRLTEMGFDSLEEYRLEEARLRQERRALIAETYSSAEAHRRLMQNNTGPAFQVGLAKWLRLRSVAPVLVAGEAGGGYRWGMKAVEEICAGVPPSRITLREIAQRLGLKAAGARLSMKRAGVRGEGKPALFDRSEAERAILKMNLPKDCYWATEVNGKLRSRGFRHPRSILSRFGLSALSGQSTRSIYGKQSVDALLQYLDDSYSDEDTYAMLIAAGCPNKGQRFRKWLARAGAANDRNRYLKKDIDPIIEAFQATLSTSQCWEILQKIEPSILSPSAVNQPNFISQWLRSRGLVPISRPGFEPKGMARWSKEEIQNLIAVSKPWSGKRCWSLTRKKRATKKEKRWKLKSK